MRGDPERIHFYGSLSTEHQVRWGADFGVPYCDGYLLIWQETFDVDFETSRYDG